MESNKSYKASAELVRRAGLEKDRYMTKDGQYFIISEGDLRFMASRGIITPEEFVSGLPVVIITTEERNILISEGGYNLTGEPLPEKPETSSSSSEEEETKEETVTPTPKKGK